MDEKQMLLKTVEQYARTGTVESSEIKVTRVQDQKTTFVEQFAEGGRSLMMKEYKVDGKIYWAGYSSRSQTVYISFSSPDRK
jgi:hypothetical protein